MARWSRDLQTGGLTESGLQKALKDLEPQDNRLSVFLVNEDKSNLLRIVAAFAATRDRTAAFDYILMKLDELEKLGIHWKRTPAKTADDDVNASHLDLNDLSQSNLVDLAHAFISHADPVRVPEKDVKELIRQGLKCGHIKRCKVNLKEDRKFWRWLDSEALSN